jgi:hypothetical protein
VILPKSIHALLEVIEPDLSMEVLMRAVRKSLHDLALEKHSETLVHPCITKKKQQKWAANQLLLRYARGQNPLSSTLTEMLPGL